MLCDADQTFVAFQRKRKQYFNIVFEELYFILHESSIDPYPQRGHLYTMILYLPGPLTT